MILLSIALYELALSMQKLGERMESDGRRLNSQSMINHSAELQQFAHLVRMWIRQIKQEESKHE